MPQELKGFVRTKQLQALWVIAYSALLGILVTLGFIQFYWLTPDITVELLQSMVMKNVVAVAISCILGLIA